MHLMKMGCILLRERMILYMGEKKYMSGCQLRQYLHISTRKMKYLMDHDYIPHENTGHATHKYRVLVEDAEVFKYRMENETGFLAELNGMFSNRTEWHPRPLIEVTEENCNAFRATRCSAHKNGGIADRMSATANSQNCPQRQTTWCYCER